jgi:hypothetical protein
MAALIRLAACCALLVVAYATPVLAQDEDEGQVKEGGAKRSDSDAFAVPLQQYTDPENRFSFVAPATWGRLPSSGSGEVTFQGPGGDSIRISVAPLEVDRRAFESAYAETYMKVLSESFTDVRYIGARPIEINRRPATDHVFSAMFRNTPVTCHQVLVFGSDRVLYITFAGFGRTRETSEQLFLTSLSTFWVNPALVSPVLSGLTDPNAPAFVLPLPEGWVEDQKPDGNSFIFRPPNSRPMSAFISARVTKIGDGFQFKAVDDAFVDAYASLVASNFAAETFELRAKRRVTLGGEPAARYDYVYISNLGIRRAILVMTMRSGYLIGVSCDSVEQGYPIYERAFENLVSGFRFK